MFTGAGQPVMTAANRKKARRKPRGGATRRYPDQIAVPNGPVMQVATTDDHFARMADRQARR